MNNMDPHQRPPDGIRSVYKQYQKMQPGQLDLDPGIVHLSGESPPDRDGKMRIVKHLDQARLTASFRAFTGGRDLHTDDGAVQGKLAVYEHEDMPGGLSI